MFTHHRLLMERGHKKLTLFMIWSAYYRNQYLTTKKRHRKPMPFQRKHYYCFIKDTLMQVVFSGGEDGIRTHGTHFTYTAFPMLRLKPSRPPLRDQIIILHIFKKINSLRKNFFGYTIEVNIFLKGLIK